MSVYEFGRFRLDADRLSLSGDGASLALGPKVVATLLALVERPGEVVAKETLLERVWPDGFVEEANLVQNVYVLRKTLRAYGLADAIETIPRIGYRFVAPVRGSETDRRRSAAAPYPNRLIAGFAGLLFLAISLGVAASHGFGHRNASKALSEGGARAYHAGRYAWNLRTRRGVRESLRLFQRVIESDPYDARGYAALADVNVTMGDYCYGTHTPAFYFARAEEYAKSALALDSNSVEAHASLGFLALHRSDERAAFAELERAIALNPAYAPAHEWRGIGLLRRGDFAEGSRELERAANLDPLAVTTSAWLGSVAYAERRFSDAIVYTSHALELSPQRIDALVIEGKAYEAQGRLDLAIEAFKRFAAIDPYYRVEAAPLLAHAYASSGRGRQAREELEYARRHAHPHDISLAIENAAIFSAS